VRDDEAAMNKMLQVWFNPGVHLDSITNAKVETSIVDPTEVPTYQDADPSKGMSAKVLIGSYAGVTNKASKTYDVPHLGLIYCTLPPGGSTTLNLDPTSMCWLYNCTNSGVLHLEKNEDNKHIPLNQQTCVIASPGLCSIKLYNKVSEPCNFYIGTGKPWGEGLVPLKLLGHDGALVGSTEEEVRSKMAEFEAKKDDFGK
jgi:hypothetical protein